MSDTNQSPNTIEIDGEALARAYHNPSLFKDMVEKLRRKGAADRDILRAMASAKTLTNALR